MTRFYIDGKRHAVSPEDTIFMEGPAVYVGRTSGRINLAKGDTITLLCSNMAPGEAVTITSHLPQTVFFRQMERDQEDEATIREAQSC